MGRSVAKSYPETTGVRMARFFWAYGMGGLANKELNQFAREWTVRHYAFEQVCLWSVSPRRLELLALLVVSCVSPFRCLFMVRRTVLACGAQPSIIKGACASLGAQGHSPLSTQARVIALALRPRPNYTFVPPLNRFVLSDCLEGEI